MFDTQRTRLIPVLGAAVLGGWLLAGTAAQAQDYGTQGMEQPMPQLDDATLDRFVDAFVAVRAIHDEFSAELQTVTDEAAAQELQQEAQAEMVAAVQDNGISVDDYNAIGTMLQSDPALLEDVQRMAEERM